MVGSKGDMKHHMECGYLERSYHKLGKNVQAMMCSLCHAGAPGLDFEDCSESPLWSDTMYASRPWSTTPPLTCAPYDNTKPEKLFCLDLFHLYKVGLGRHLCGAGICILSRLGFFDDGRESKAFPERLKRAHAAFKLWASAEAVKPGLRSFKPAFFGIKSKKTFPWANSKGSDTIIMCRWLRFYTSLALQEDTRSSRTHGDFLKLLNKTMHCALEVFRVVHHHGLWLEHPCAKYVYARLLLLIKGYRALARKARGLKLAGFALVPKFHALHHVAHSIADDLRRGCTLVLNPLVAACEQNEDVTGRISKLARELNTRTLTSNVLERHLFKKRAVMSRHVRVRPKGK